MGVEAVTADQVVAHTMAWAEADSRAAVVCLKWAGTAVEASIRTKKKDKQDKNISNL